MGTRHSLWIANRGLAPMAKGQPLVLKCEIGAIHTSVLPGRTHGRALPNETISVVSVEAHAT